MDRSTQQTDPPSTPSWWPLWGGRLWKSFAQPFVPPTAAPESLSQPILPGWAFGNVITVTERNSSAPETEQAIVAEESYGRQLGHVIEALVVLIGERPGEAQSPKALSDLLELHARIRGIKAGLAADRLQRIEADLARLKTERPEDYRRLAAAIAADVRREAADRNE
jgi:hypothetical protein